MIEYIYLVIAASGMAFMCWIAKDCADAFKRQIRLNELMACEARQKLADKNGGDCVCFRILEMGEKDKCKIKA